MAHLDAKSLFHSFSSAPILRRRFAWMMFEARNAKRSLSFKFWILKSWILSCKGRSGAKITVFHCVSLFFTGFDACARCAADFFSWLRPPENSCFRAILTVLVEGERLVLVGNIRPGVLRVHLHPPLRRKSVAFSALLPVPAFSRPAVNAMAQLGSDSLMLCLNVPSVEYFAAYVPIFYDIKCLSTNVC